jgi:hypothetical protein
VPEQSAGATPVAGGATPPQTPAQPAAPTTPATPAAPATGDDDGLGEPGKRAIRAERERAAAAERERDELKQRLEDLENSSKTEHEREVAQAKKDGAAEALTKVQAQVRRSEVRAALSGAGVSGAMLDLASKADEFTTLKVTDEGVVQGLDQAIADFKKAMPDLFKAQPAGGGKPPDFGGGPRGTPAGAGQSLNDYIRRAAGRA